MSAADVAGELHDFSKQEPGRRWYPVIDYSRCTNCMECIDFCLFGVYGVDTQRSHPGRAAGQLQEGLPGVQPRLSRERDHLPGTQNAGHRRCGRRKWRGSRSTCRSCSAAAERTPWQMAVAERDAELVADGRDAVGMAVGVPKRQCGAATRPATNLTT